MSAFFIKKAKFCKCNPIFPLSTFIIVKRCSIEINVSSKLNTHTQSHTQATLSNICHSFWTPASQPRCYGWGIPDLRRQCSPPTVTVSKPKTCFPSFHATGIMTPDASTTNQRSPPKSTKIIQSSHWAQGVTRNTQGLQQLGCQLQLFILCSDRSGHQTSSTGWLRLRPWPYRSNPTLLPIRRPWEPGSIFSNNSFAAQINHHWLIANNQES